MEKHNPQLTLYVLAACVVLTLTGFAVGYKVGHVKGTLSLKAQIDNVADKSLDSVSEKIGSKGSEALKALSDRYTRE